MKGTASAHKATVISRPQTRFALGLVLGLALLLPVALVITLVFAFTAPWPLFAFLGLTFALIGAYMVDAITRVTVGDDGVFVWRRFRSYFLPFSEIADVIELDGIVMRFVLHTGESVDVYTGKDEPVAKPEYVETCDKLLVEVRARLQAYRDRSQGTLQVETAVRDLAYQMLRGEEEPAKTPYRTVPAPAQEELWKVVEGGASNRSRAAAAALLSREAGEQERPKLRVAAQSTADPRLRKFFRVAADHRDAKALREALEELEAEEPRSRRAARQARGP